MLSSGCHLNEIPYLTFSFTDDATSTFYLARRTAIWLLSRPWWSRIWTVQECVLPLTATVYYEPVIAPFRMFELDIEQLDKHKTTCCAEIVDIRSITAFIHNALGDLRKLRRIMHSAHHSSNTEPLVRLEQLLRVFRNREATNEKDKVYGLLGLVSNWQHFKQIVPDYRKSATIYEVYTKAVIKMNEVSASFDLFCQQAMQIPDPMKSLPAWVPDFSNPEPAVGEGTLYVDQVNAYNASRALSFCLEVIETYVLTTKGVHIDELDSNCTILSFTTKRTDLQEKLKDWYDVVQKHFKQDFLAHQEDFWQTLCGGTVYRNDTENQMKYSFGGITSQDEHLFNRWCVSNGLSELQTSVASERSKKKTMHSESIGAMDQAIRTTITGRHMMITKEGYIGMAPRGSIIGRQNRIFALPGSRSLFPLRLVGTRLIPGRGMQQCHQIIGHCYLSGFVDGEGVSAGEEINLYLV